jgi:transcriptional regulator with XRE-family HTH domain
LASYFVAFPANYAEIVAMSHFTDCLFELLAAEKMTQGALAEASNVERSTVSRIAAGRPPSRGQLAALCSAISQDRSRRVKLLLAHLRDEAESVHRVARLDARHYVIASSDAVEAQHVQVPAHLYDDICLLVDEASQHDDLCSILREHANLVRRYREANFQHQLKAVGDAPLPEGVVLGDLSDNEAGGFNAAALALDVLKRRAAQGDAPQVNKASPVPSK